MVPVLIQNLGSTKIPICTASFNCLKAYSNKIGGLIGTQLRPGIVANNLYLGIEGNKTNMDNIKQFLIKLQGGGTQRNDDYDQLEKELMKQTPGICKNISNKNCS